MIKRLLRKHIVFFVEIDVFKIGMKFQIVKVIMKEKIKERGYLFFYFGIYFKVK